MYLTLLKKLPWLCYAGLLIAIDQYSKLYIYDWLASKINKVVEICSFFNIVLVWNKGISFGLFGNLWDSNLIFAIIAILLTICLSVWLIRTNERMIETALSMIIAGAIGNICDRFSYGAVLDFLEFHIGPYYYPSFNIADSCVCVGVGLLMLDGLLRPSKS